MFPVERNVGEDVSSIEPQHVDDLVTYGSHWDTLIREVSMIITTIEFA